jgi:putative proteasome-type protease
VTLCIGIQVEEGLLALADTKIVKGEEQIIRGKLSNSSVEGSHWWLMTSGLRSVRDKTVIYLEQEIAEKGLRFNHLFELANQFGTQLRRVRTEDGPSLEAGNLAFNLHAILGGRMPGDPTAKMFFVYPEGNWIEATVDTPYFMIGRTSYAKAMVERLLSSEMPLRQAFAVAFLAFEATIASVTDVGYPIDVIALDGMSGTMNRQRFDASDLEPISHWWRKTLSDALVTFPIRQFDSMFDFRQSPEERGPS